MKSPFRRALTPRLTSRSFFWHRSLIGKPRAGDISGGMGAKDQNHQQAKATFLERAWTWIHVTFPERQIYIRSDGRVQFFTFGPSLQATLAGLALIFLGWVAFSTVNVVFKDRIIAAKDNRFQQMQSAYENRLADLQISYDELNGALVTAEDKFKSTADALTAKQNAIGKFLNRKDQVENAITAHNAGPVIVGAPAGAPGADTGVASDSVGFSGAVPGDSDDSADSSLSVMPGPALPQPRGEQPGKGSMLKALDAQTTRLAALGGNEVQLMSQTEIALNSDVGLLRTAVKRTGINPDQ